MWSWLTRDSVDTKARALARALRAQYGSGAAAVCRAALTRPELVGHRRRVVRMTMYILDGGLANASDHRAASRLRTLAARLDLI